MHARLRAVAAQSALRRSASLVFTAAAFGLFALITGLIGFRPRRHFNFVTSGRLLPGEWTDQIIWDQVLVGAALLTVAAIVFYRVNRRL